MTLTAKSRGRWKAHHNCLQHGQCTHEQKKVESCAHAVSFLLISTCGPLDGGFVEACSTKGNLSNGFRPRAFRTPVVSKV
jgi:hypothetical protein